ncbi:MAG TPA: DUF4189 domain-containing protein [Stellaceae bacterium]|jgi:hypothetical protein|nr:DUF4189 domain-containing protein [Stellaceae bacterium]
MRRVFVIAALFFGALLWFAASAQAQCSTVCSNYIQGECSEHTTTCANPAPASPNFGAIAYGAKSGAWGYSYNWNTRKQAEDNALANCKKNASDCEVQVWYQRECGAVVSADGGDVYWGTGDGTGAAGGNALASCKKDGGKNCTIKVEQCSR